MNVRIFIHRPILAIVISIIIALCGLVAIKNLPVTQYPNISPPSISVRASYPGASADTVEKTVAAQIESKLNGVSNLLYMNSFSGSGGASIRLTFEVGTDLNFAVNEVLNRVHAATPLLPAVVQQLGVIVRKSSPDMLMVLTFYNNGSGKFTNTYLSNYVNHIVSNDLSLVPGMGDVGVWGYPYAIRFWLDVNKMNSLNITPQDIEAAVRDQSSENIIGKSSAMPTKGAVLTFNVSGSEMFSDPKQYENIIIRANGSQIIRVKDVARVELGATGYDIVSKEMNVEHGTVTNQEAVAMSLKMDPTANQLAVKQGVLARLAFDAKNFPTGMSYGVMYDASKFVSASINNVQHTLIEAFILVGLVILLFLHNARASIIALVTVPVAILGTFMCLYIFDSSINTLSLFAMILAIGIVVDDAIVVVENIERLKVKYPGLGLKQIVELAMNEVIGAVIAIALVLSVVFLPVMFLSGLSGALYRQFAITIACTVVISAIVALTLTPALSSLLLKEHVHLNKFSLWFNRKLDLLTKYYLKMAEKIIDNSKYAIFGLVVVVVAIVLIFKIIPRSFIPNEDQGNYFVSISLPSSSSLPQTEKTTAQIAAMIAKRPGVKSIMQVNGVDFMSGSNNTYSALLVVILDNWAKRKNPDQSVDGFLQFTNGLNGAFKNVVIRGFNMPPIHGLGSTGGVEFYLEDRTIGDLAALDKEATKLDQRLMKHKEIRLAYHLLNTNVEQIKIVPDVDQAKFYGVNIASIYSTLNAIYSTKYVNQTYAYIMQALDYLILQADYRYRKNINNISNVYVRNTKGKLVPEKSLVKTVHYKMPETIERFNSYLATQEIVSPNKGFSSGDVMNVIATEMQQVPKGYDYEWFGTSFMQSKSTKTSTIAFIFSLCMIYLVLSALYEMWRLPWVVIMGAPFALLGSGIMLLLRNQPNDLYFQISLITLMGLSAKNIILLIEFALKHFEQGHSAKDSILYALQIRFRPIVMTSITFVMGALPLIFATGAGANAEHSVGTGIVGGMIGSVVLGTLFVPSYFVLVMKNFKRQKTDV